MVARPHANNAVPAGERMSKVDTAWLRMDCPSHLMMIVGVWVVQPGIRYEDLRQRVQYRPLKYPRFVQCAVEDATGATWRSDPNFDLANHLVIETLPRKPVGREQEALQDRLGHDGAYPPLHRRWHCTDIGDPVAGGWRRSATGAATPRAPQGGT